MRHISEFQRKSKLQITSSRASKHYARHEIGNSSRVYSENASAAGHAEAAIRIKAVYCRCETQPSFNNRNLGTRSTKQRRPVKNSHLDPPFKREEVCIKLVSSPGTFGARWRRRSIHGCTLLNYFMDRCLGKQAADP